MFPVTLHTLTDHLRHLKTYVKLVYLKFERISEVEKLSNEFPKLNE